MGATIARRPVIMRAVDCVWCAVFHLSGKIDGNAQIVPWLSPIANFLEKVTPLHGGGFHVASLIGDQRSSFSANSNDGIPAAVGRRFSSRMRPARGAVMALAYCGRLLMPTSPRNAM